MVKGTSAVKLVGVYNKKAFRNGRLFAVRTRLELVTSCVTGRLQR